MFLYSYIKWIVLFVAILFGIAIVVSVFGIKRVKGNRRLILFGITILLALIFILLMGNFIRVMWFPFPQV
jgi:hypothetical protein